MANSYATSLGSSYRFLNDMTQNYIMKINGIRSLELSVNSQYDLKFIFQKAESFKTMKNQLEKAISAIDDVITSIQRISEIDNADYRQQLSEIINPIIGNEDHIRAYKEAKSQLLLIDDIINYLNETALRGQETVAALERETDLGTHREEPFSNDLARALQASFTELSQSIAKANINNRNTLVVPKFDGRIENFNSYWGRFKRLIDENDNYETLEKVNLLCEGLSGEALSAIQGIEPSAQNYDQLKNILLEEFGSYTVNKVQLINNLRKVKKATNIAEDCIRALRETKTIIRQLEAAGSIITPEFCLLEVTNKFPFHIVKSILIDKTQDWKVEEMLATITQNVRTLQLREKSEKEFTNTVSDKGHLANTDGKSSEIIRQKVKEEKKQWPCLFCNDTQHRSYQCTSVDTVEEKRDVLKKENRCWICFSPQHRSKDCKKQKCHFCKGDHNSVVCQKGIPEDIKKEKISTNIHVEKHNPFSQYDMKTDYSDESNIVILPQVEENEEELSHQQVILRTAESWILCNKSKLFKPVKILIDEGSMRSFIKADTAAALGLPHFNKKVRTYYGIGGLKSSNESSEVKLVFHTKDGSVIYTKMITKPALTEPFLSPNLNPADREFIKSRKLELATSMTNGEIFEPDIILGMDRYRQFMKMNGELELPSKLMLKDSVFGYLIHGCVNDSFRTVTSGAYTTIEEGLGREVEDHEMIRNIFDIDSLGISTEDHKIDQTNNYYREYVKNLKIENGRIVAPLPLKHNIRNLKPNFFPSLYRLKALWGKIQHDALQVKWYKETFEDYLKNDIIEEVPSEEENTDKVFYLPHHGVWKLDKPKPLRIVFDGSAKQRDSPSLNETIHTGLSYVNKIHDILVIARTMPIIITCDIESAFLQIALKKEHRDWCRFLWVKNLEAPITGKNVKQFRFKRLPFGLTASPSILNMCLTWYLTNSQLEIAREILQCLYVDNIILFAQTTEEAAQKCRMVKELFRGVSMNVRQFLCNDESIIRDIPEADRYPMHNISILGASYKPYHDAIGVNLSMKNLSSPTKRGLLQQLHSLYDPIGLINPLTIRLKFMFREVCDKKYSWDEALPNEMIDEWNNHVQDIKTKTSIHLKRATMDKMSETELWVFADASATALACCAYFKYPQGTSYLISGKSRLAPRNKTITIPRLELLAIRLAMRLATSINSAIPSLKGINIASDSTIALSWISNGRTLPAYVSHQVHEINKAITVIESRGKKVSLYHVDTKFNPADIGSRGGSMQQLFESHWMFGPLWLTGTKEECKYITEYKIKLEQSEVQLVQLEEQPASPLIYNLTYRESHYANLRILAKLGKLIRLWVKRAIPNKELTSAIKDLTDEEMTTPQDIRVIEKLLIKQSQLNLNIQELKERHKGFEFFKDESGVIRVKSRLQHAPIPYETKNPVYIPKNSPFTDHLVMHFHRETQHQGKDFVAVRLRQEYFVDKPSQTIKRVLKNCLVCRKYHSLPFGTPLMPSLPKDRVTISKPFMNTGCDLLGPLLMKDKERIYVCLFTCMTTRAVHLELVPDQSSKAFMNAFNRFISRRGVPEIMRSDGAGNFTLSSKMIEIFEKCNERELTTEGLITYFATKRIRWLFNTPLAPWKGGCWERLVGITKIALKKSIGRRLVSLDDFSTLLVKIEAILNTRPLTHPDPNELNRLPIRPIDFLNPVLAFSLPDTNIETRIYPDGSSIPIIQTMEQAIEAIQLSTDVTTQFWHIFLKEYLLYIRDIYKHSRKQGACSAQKPEEGEVVIIQEDNMPRGSWKLGRILELIRGTDGEIRSAKVKTGAGNVITRSLNHLYSMEIKTTAPTNPNVTKLNVGNYRTKFDPRKSYNAQPVKDTLGEQLLETNNREVGSTAIENSEETTANMFRDNEMLEKSKTTVLESGASGKIESIMNRSDNSEPIVTQEETMLEHGEEFQIPATTDVTTDRRWWMPGRMKRTVQQLKARRDCPKWLKKQTKRPAINKQVLLICCIIALSIQGTNANSHHCNEAKLFSQHILANPQCDEASAWATIIIPLMVLILIITCACRLVRGQVTNKTWSRRAGEVARNMNQRIKGVDLPPVNSETLSEEPVDLEADLERGRDTLRIPEYMRIGSRLSLMMVMSIVHMNLVQGCQDAHIRQSTQIICTNRTSCFKEYSRDFTLSYGAKSACMEFSHQNQSIGSVVIRVDRTIYKCLSTIEFYTRETVPRVTSIKRCSSLGSCDDSCETINPKRAIYELSPYRYPYQVGCKRGCGFIFCGCGTWSDSCTFHKLEHIPHTETVYKVVTCNSWSTEVELNIQTNLLQRKEVVQIKIKPYETYKNGLFNLTMTSHKRPPVYGLQRSFAISNQSSYIVDKETIITKCPNEKEAKHNFQNCTVTKRCECLTDQNHQTACHCPSHQFTKKENQLPQQPFEGTINIEKGDIVIEPKLDESTFALESSIMLEGSSFVYDFPCYPTFVNITGCYSCNKGAVVWLRCMAQETNWISIQCNSETFMIKCGPSDPSTSLNYYADQALPSEVCHTKCAGIDKAITIEGHLYYVSDTGGTISMKSETSRNSRVDLSPLWTMVTSRGMIVSVGIMILLIIIAITYATSAVVVSHSIQILTHLAYYTFMAMRNSFKFFKELLVEPDGPQTDQEA